MIDLIFYSTNSKQNEVNKNLTEIIKLSGRLKEETSILNPVIEINKNNSILTANYLYIPEFKRYYYITDISVNLMFFEISCKVDALMSFKTDILSSTQVISRQENNFNLDLEDRQIPLKSDKTLTIKQINTTTPFKINAEDYLNKENYFYLLNIGNLE